VRLPATACGNWGKTVSYPFALIDTTGFEGKGYSQFEKSLRQRAEQMPHLFLDIPTVERVG